MLNQTEIILRAVSLRKTCGRYAIKQYIIKQKIDPRLYRLALQLDAIPAG